MAENKNFELQLEELDSIIKKLENNKLSLDEALVQYKNGIEIIQECNEIIKNAEEQVKNLSKELNFNE